MATTAWVIWLCACTRYWPDHGLVFKCVTCFYYCITSLHAGCKTIHSLIESPLSCRHNQNKLHKQSAKLHFFQLFEHIVFQSFSTCSCFMLYIRACVLTTDNHVYVTQLKIAIIYRMWRLPLNHSITNVLHESISQLLIPYCHFIELYKVTGVCS